MRQLITVALFAASSALANPSISLWNAHNPSSYLDSAIAEFEKQQNVEVIKNNFLSEKLREEVLNMAKINALPDVLYVPSDFVGIHNLISLSPIDESWVSPQTEARVLASGTTDEALYGIPLFQGNHLVLYYNRELIDKPATTWRELRQQHADKADQLDYLITWNFREMYWFIPFLSAFDGWPVKDNQVTLNTPEVQKALSYYKSLYDIGLVDSACDHDCSVERFKQGETAYMINGDWIYKDLSSNMGDKLGVAVLPSIEGKPMLPMFSSYVLAFPNLKPSSAKFEKIRQFALFMQSKDAQNIIYSEGKLIPSNTELAEELESDVSENDKMMLDQMEQTKAMPSDHAMTVAWIAMLRGFNRFMDHDYSAAQAAEYMQSVADREMRKMKNAK